MNQWRSGGQHRLHASVRGQSPHAPSQTIHGGHGLRHGPTTSTRAFGDLTIEGAIDRYVSDLQAEMPPQVIALLRQTARPLSAFFGTRCLRRISLTDLIAYQHARRNDGGASSVVDSELSVLLQLLDYGRLCRGLGESDWPVLTDEEQPAPSSTALPPTDVERAVCPCCRGTTLVFRRLHVLLSRRSGRDRDGEELNRLRYAQEWTCENAACGYRRVTNCRTDVHDMP